MTRLAVFGSALTFYALTLAPTVMWSDSASFSWRAYLGRFRFGTAEDHPVFLMVAWLFTRVPGDVARNVNFASALFAALAVLLVYHCGRRLGASRAAAATGAAALCVSHAFWQHAVLAEVYTANAFFLLALVALLLDWRRTRSPGWLVAAAATFLLGLGNHLVLATAMPAVAVFIVLVTGRALLTRTFFIGVGLVLVTVIALSIWPPPPLVEAFHRLWNGPAPIAEYLTPKFEWGAMAKEAGYYVLLLAYQFPSVSLLLGVAGTWTLVRRDREAAALLLGALAANAAIFIHHTVWPATSGTKYVFYIADYALFGVLCAVGAEAVLRRCAEWLPRRRSFAPAALMAIVAVVPPAIYAAAPVVIRSAGLQLFSARSLPYRDNVQFFLNPNKRGYDGARRFAEEAFAVVRPNAVLFADHTPYAVLRYMQIVEGRRQDVLVPSIGGDISRVRWMFSEGRRRPTYLAAAPRADYYDLSGLDGPFDIVPVGPIFEVRPR